MQLNQNTIIMKLYSHIALFAIVIISPLYASSQSNPVVQNTLQKYKQCLINKDASLIKDIVDKSFRLDVYEQPYSSGMFASFLKIAQAPDSVYWDEPTEADVGKLDCMVYYVLGEQTLSSLVTLSGSGQLLFSDWLDSRGRSFYRRVPSEFVTSIPFKFVDNKIIIKARLNKSDTELNMLFDTGADGMALRTDLQEKCGVKITRSQSTNVPGGQMQVKMSDGNNLVLDSLIIPRQSLVLFDNILSKEIHGIIGGSNLFRNFITEVDFDNNVIRLYKHGIFKATENYQQCNMTYVTGVPTVPFQIYCNGHEFKSEFIFDTGAGYEAIMFGSGMKQLEHSGIDTHIPVLYESYNYSVGHKEKIVIGSTDSVTLANMTFRKVNLAMEPYKAESHGRHNVLGSIGIKTLSRFNWIVDLTAYQIYSKPNNNSHLPMDFILNGYAVEYFGQYLRVVRSLSQVKNTDDTSLKSGDYILKLNDIPALELTTEKLEHIIQSKQVYVELSRDNKIITNILTLKKTRSRSK